MTPLHIPIIMSMISTSILINNAQARENYCVGLSNKECESIKSADTALKEQPSYCKDGFALPENPYNLSNVQIRICDITWGRGIENKQYEEEIQKRDKRERIEKEEIELINRRIEDAKALAREDATPYINLIKQIQTGYSCGIMDQWMADAAITKLNYFINVGLSDAGLVGEYNISKEISGKIEQALDAGKEMANNGACENMSPVYRARLFKTARALIY
jgi:hypothetical protein